MEKREEIVKELQALAPRLAALPKVNFVKAPEGYFAQFKVQMLDLVDVKLATEELKVVAPALAKLKMQSAETAPSGYFNNFSATLLQKIRTDEYKEELAQVAPVMAQLQKPQTVVAPANYFNSLPQSLLQKALANERTEVAPAMPQWLQSINAVLENVVAAVFKPRYAVAFSGTATMVIIAVMLFVKVEQQCTDAECKLASVSSAELDAYFDANSDEFSSDVLDYSFDKEKIEDYGKQDNKALDKGLNQLTEDELNQALLD
ncbi:MAG: hypothetical protein U0V74_09135 [Chitinophagales bacterium]